MTERMYLEFLDAHRYGKVDIAFDYGDVVISGRLLEMGMTTIDLPGWDDAPHNVVKIDGYPFAMTIPFRSVKVTVESIVPGDAESNPISIDSDAYERKHLGRWVKVNGLKTGRLIGHVRTDGFNAPETRLEVKDTFVFEDGTTFVVNRSKDLDDDS